MFLCAHGNPCYNCKDKEGWIELFVHVFAWADGRVGALLPEVFNVRVAFLPGMWSDDL